MKKEIKLFVIVLAILSFTVIGIAARNQADDKVAANNQYVQRHVDSGDIGSVNVPLVSELTPDYPVGGVVLYTDNFLYYKGRDGWHFMNGTNVNPSMVMAFNAKNTNENMN